MSHGCSILLALGLLIQVPAAVCNHISLHFLSPHLNDAMLDSVTYVQFWLAGSVLLLLVSFSLLGRAQSLT